MFRGYRVLSRLQIEEDCKIGSDVRAGWTGTCQEQPCQLSKSKVHSSQLRSFEVMMSRKVMTSSKVMGIEVQSSKFG